MTNYYEELKLDKDASAAEISSELIRLESVWHKREMSRPELAAEKLALIVQAKKVFVSEASKAQYDRKLNAPAKEEVPEDPNAQRAAQFKKWYGEAIQYANAGQADLAKTAIERAMSYGVDEDDAAFFYLASQIYRSNEDLATALGYINRAIVSDGEMAEYYLEKALVLDGLYLQAYKHNADNAATYLRQTRDTLLDAASRAASLADDDARGRALGSLAFSHYFRFRSINDRTQADESQAEAYAQEALRLGDRWGNAQMVLDDMEERRRAAEKVERDAQARREEEERRHQQAEEEARKRKAEEARKLRAKQGSTVLSWVLYLVGWAGSLYSIYRVFTLGDVGIQLTTIIVYASAVLLNFGDTSKDGEGSTISLVFSIAYGIAYSFAAATVAYTNMGYSAQSAASTWKICLISLATYLVLMFVARMVGTMANEKTSI